MEDTTFLTPLDSEPKIRRIAALDIEGDATEGGFVTSCLLYDNVPYICRSPKELISLLTSKRFRNVHVYCHNLNYDMGCLLPHIPRNFSAMFTGQNLFKGWIGDDYKHRVRLNDSAGMAAYLSISALGKALNIPKLDAPDGLYNDAMVADCKREFSPDERTAIDYYCQRDTEIALKYIETLQDQLVELGSELKDTLASTGLTLFRRSYLDDEYKTPYPYRNDFARMGYYGGRVEPFVVGEISNVRYYDFTSLYPSVMLGHNYPNPNTLEGPVVGYGIREIMDFEGLSEVEIEVPEMPYPPLPYRFGDKLYFPYGTFRGVYTNVELRYAIELGCKIKKVYQSLISRDTVRPFDRFVRSLFTLREELKQRGDCRQLVIKIILNSLYGKFAQREDGPLFRIVTNEEYTRLGTPEGSEVLIYDNSEYWKVPLESRGQAEYVIVPWAAYVSGYARIALHKAMLQSTGKVIYVDTDSIVTTGILPTGSGLGELKLEETCKTFEAYAPKVYRYTNDKGEDVYKAKGVPKMCQKEYIERGIVSYQTPTGWLEASRHNLHPSVWQTVSKRLLLTNPKRCYRNPRPRPGECSDSLPFRASDLRRVPRSSIESE